MAKRLQHRGGTTSQHSSFTGAVREVTVDTDKNTLVVHDGATAGGHPLATATNFKSTGIDDNATSTAISIDSSQNVSFNDDTGNTEKLVWNATDESLILKYHPTYGDYYIAYKVPQVVAGGVTSDVVLLIGEKDVNQIRIQGRFYTPLPPNINDNRNAFIVDIIYQQWNGQLPRFSYDAIHTGSRANTVDNMELGEAVYNGTTYYAIKIQANYASLSGVPIYFTGGITNTTDLGWLPEGNLTSFTAVTPSSQDSSDKRISAENIRFKNEKNEDKMLITSDGNISFYEDTGTTATMVWNATTERLGIGTGNPQNKLDISAITWNDGITIKNTGDFNVGIFGDANRTSAGGGLLNLAAKWNAKEVAGILFQAGSDTTNKDDGDILFRTSSANNISEKMRINSSGQTLIGTTVAPANANTKLMVHTPISSSSLNVIEMSHNTNGANKAGAALGLSIGNGGEATNAASLLFKTASGGSLGERMRIDPNGNIGIGTTNSTAAKVFINHEGDVDDNGLYVYSNIGQTVPLVKVIQDGAGSTAPAVYIRNDDADGIALHLYKGSSVVTPHTEANSLFIEDSNHAGITIGSGTSKRSSLYFANTTDNDIAKIVVAHDEGSMKFTNNTAERMRIDASGNVGIGTSSPTSLFHIESSTADPTLQITNKSVAAIDTGPDIEFWNNPFTATTVNSYESGAIRVRKENGSNNNHDHYMSFWTRQNSPEGINERMRISAAGGTTFNAANGGGVAIHLKHNEGTQPYGMLINFTAASPDNNTNYYLKGVDSTTDRFLIWSDGDLDNHDNSYGAISDERIKQDIVDSNSQWNDIKAVRVRNFKKKDDVRQYGENAKTQIGVVAQELETVSPSLIKHKEPSKSDILADSSFGTLYEEGDEIPEGKEIGDVKEVHDQVKKVSYSVLYMKSIKALQEAMERIETLEAKVTALENN
jgi:hypothetical protein